MGKLESEKMIENHGHGSIKVHGLERVYFRFSERPDGQYDFTMADDKAFSVAVETRVLPSIREVAHEIGSIGHSNYSHGGWLRK